MHTPIEFRTVTGTTLSYGGAEHRCSVADDSGTSPNSLSPERAPREPGVTLLKTRQCEESGVNPVMTLVLQLFSAEIIRDY